MSFELLVGPPGSGKTHLLMERAVELAGQGKRVWWAGLPGQRAEVYRRATLGGALLGLEFQTLQQVYYRLLAHARRLKPLIVGTGRLALVGEALAIERQALPSPGEARLFAAAVAEAKRYGLSPAELPSGDAEVDRFRATFLAYERLKGEAWDYDDFRIEALRLAECGEAVTEADALIVDGLRELAPLDLRLLTALGLDCEVRLALPRTPPGWTPTAVLEARVGAAPAVYQAANPVSEARWVLNSLKRDLACGLDSLELAVILPRGESVAFGALADEYGVPVMDERPTALADSRPGRLLLDLLELPDHPSASRLLPIRELAPLADAALEEGVAGHAALARLAGRLGLGDTWNRWLERLRVPDEQAGESIDTWAADLVDLALSLAASGAAPAGEAPPGEAAGEAAGGPAGEKRAGDLPYEQSAGGSSDVSLDRFRDQALLRAKEAQRVAFGEGFRAWWAALMADSSLTSPRRGGVALLDERQASGRRFRKAYLMHATEGSYGTGEREDYFVPEEGRLPLAMLLEGSAQALPRRFEGRDGLLFEELSAIADELIVTFPGGDQGGPLLPEAALLAGTQPQPLPPLAAASRLELVAGESYRAPLTGSGGIAWRGEPISLEDLRRFDECAMRYWLEGLLGERRVKQERERGELGESNAQDPGSWVHSLRHDLIAQRRLDEERLAALAARYPQAAGWLARQRNELLDVSFGVELPVIEAVVSAQLDAAVTREGTAMIFAITAPGVVVEQASAQAFLEERWTELWTAGHMLDRFKGRVTKVRLFVWPLLGEPIEAYEGGIRSVWRRIDYRREWAQAAFERLTSGSIEPSPGFRCSRCRVRDICREGAR